MKCRGAEAVLCLLALCGACGSKELTRSKAKQIIENSDQYALAKHEVFLTRPEVNELVKRRYLAWHNFAISYQLVLTQAGKQYFERASGEAVGLDAESGRLVAPLLVVPKAPLRSRVLAIAGITGD